MILDRLADRPLVVEQRAGDLAGEGRTHPLAASALGGLTADGEERVPQGFAVEPPPVDAPHCATVDPETTAAANGYGTATGVDATTYSKYLEFDVSFREKYDKYVAAWDSYVADTMGRPQGVRQDCAPMRFPAVGKPFKGVAVVWPGFSSCPQEVALVGPPLAAVNDGGCTVSPTSAGAVGLGTRTQPTASV